MSKAPGRLVPVMWVILWGQVLGQPSALQVDVPVKATLNGGGMHEYTVTARANQAFEVVVEQQGIDVVVTVSAPDGSTLAEVDGPTGSEGSEHARLRVLDAGTYRVRISPWLADATAGSYSVKLTGVRELSSGEVDMARSEREITAIEARWMSAVGAGDLPTLTTILRDDAIKLGTAPGAAQGRPEIVAGWERLAKMRAEQGITEKHSVKDLAVRVAGDTAMSTGRYTITRTYKDRPTPTSVTGQFVHVWKRDASGWKILGDYAFPFGRLPRAESGRVTLPPEALNAYAGAYSSRELGVTFTVLSRGDALHGKWKGPTDRRATLRR